MRPDKEPTLAIGIILPIDKRNAVSFSFTDTNVYKIKTEFALQSSGKTLEKLTVSTNDGPVKIIRTAAATNEDGITIHNVPAGRGFHWEQAIDVKLPGNVHVSTQGDSLLVKNEILLEDYLTCVAVSEMSAVCPAAFLEAQTIAARSWILAATEKKHSELGIAACNDDCCQRYQGFGQMNPSSRKAVHNSRGVVLGYNNEICDARYSKSCGGISEDVETVWALPPTAYLSSVVDGPNQGINIDWEQWYDTAPDSYCGPDYIDEKELHRYLGNVDEEGYYFRWRQKYSQQEFCAFFSKKIKAEVHAITEVVALKRGQSGRINHLYLDYQTEMGNTKTLQLNNEFDIRRTLHPSFLYSSNFVIHLDREHIELKGAGWGHGVGLCQIGALGMALNGFSSREILVHYYTGAKLEKIYT